MVRVAVAAMLLAVLGLPSAFAADRRGLPSPASTPASASDSASSTSSANASSTNAAPANASSTASVSPANASSATASASLTADALVAVVLPHAPSMSDADAAPATTVAPATPVAPKAAEIAPAAIETGAIEFGFTEFGFTEFGSTETTSTETTPAETSPAGTLSITPAPAAPSFGSDFVTSNSLAPIHALLAPPAAFIKLKTPPRTHSFFDSRNTLGFATLAASLTADALSTQKGLAYPGFVEMNPIARPFVQTRTGAAAYNAGSFGLMAGLMYWAHKTEHHKLERILPLAVGSWEGLLSARNYHVIANRAR